MTDLGDELRRLLAERGISLREAARRAGCSPGYLSNVTSGRKPLTPSVAARLEQVLGTGGKLAAYALNPPSEASGPWRGRPRLEHASRAVGGLDGDDAAEAQIEPTARGAGAGTLAAFTTARPAEALPVSSPVPEWPTWFGVRLAHLITLTDRWRDPSQLGSLQSLLNQEILMSDAAMPDDQHQVRALHALSRRQALMTLAALPSALVTPGTVTADSRSPAADTELFLSRCAASLASCWHLLRGSDLPAVEQILSAYLLPLEAAAQRGARYQPYAAQLTTQAHRICGILALHRNQLSVREHHCKRALQYAAVTSDASSHASALISLASTYFYASDPQQAAAVYEQAFSHGTALPVLQRSRVHAELAVVYGQLGREQDAIRSAGEAEELYPDHPEDDPSFLYAEFSPASLVLERGLAYVALAEQFPGRSYQHKAAEIFSRAGQPALAVPDRIRFEIVNHQANTSVLLGDLDAFETFMSCGLDGITLLGSRQRLKEMRATWHRAAARWPGEQRLKALGDALQHAAGAKDRA